MCYCKTKVSAIVFQMRIHSMNRFIAPFCIHFYTTIHRKTTIALLQLRSDNTINISEVHTCNSTQSHLFPNRWMFVDITDVPSSLCSGHILCLNILSYSVKTQSIASLSLKQTALKHIKHTSLHPTQTSQLTITPPLSICANPCFTLRVPILAPFPFPFVPVILI
mmetsp:Transcript_8972/g.15246  ORF Transcript_8972/g.15246 Transcript_8972/m.15246 type:complete len:165 (-) Transcript_8972:459-953(-)